MFILHSFNWPIRTNRWNTYIPFSGFGQQYYPINYGGYTTYPYSDQFFSYNNYSFGYNPYNYHSYYYPPPRTKIGQVANLISQIALLPYYYSNGANFGYSNYCNNYDLQYGCGASYYPSYNHFDQAFNNVDSYLLNQGTDLYNSQFVTSPSIDSFDQVFNNVDFYLLNQGMDLYNRRFINNFNTAVNYVAGDLVANQRTIIQPQARRNLGSA